MKNLSVKFTACKKMGSGRGQIKGVLRLRVKKKKIKSNPHDFHTGRQLERIEKAK